MTDKEIRTLSRKITKGRYSVSFSIVIVSVLLFVLFCIMPYSIIKITDPLKNYPQIFEKNLYPVICALTFAIFFFIRSLIFSSINIGEKAWYTGKYKNIKNRWKRFRFWFVPAASFKAFGLRFLLFFIRLFWTVAFLSPAALAFTGIIILALTGGIELYLFISLASGGLILLITGLIFRFIIIQRYFIAPYLLAVNPKIKIIQAVRQSKNLLEGHIFRIVLFKIKYIPSFFLYPFIFPAIYLYPNYKQSCSLLAKEVTI